MQGKNFSRQYFEIYILFFPRKYFGNLSNCLQRDSLYEMTMPTFWKKYIIIIIIINIIIIIIIIIINIIVIISFSI